MKKKKHVPEPSDLRQGWHPENWDAVTLAWLKTDDGKATLALLKAAPDLLNACRLALDCVDRFSGKLSPGASDRLKSALAKAEGRSS